MGVVVGGGGGGQLWGLREVINYESKQFVVIIFSLKWYIFSLKLCFNIIICSFCLDLTHICRNLCFLFDIFT